jgi:hypothetical protein
MCEDFKAHRKRMRRPNANNVGKLFWLISFCINAFVKFLQHIMFYSSKSDIPLRLIITYADVTEYSPKCTERSVVNNPLSNLDLW